MVTLGHLHLQDRFQTHSSPRGPMRIPLPRSTGLCCTTEPAIAPLNNLERIGYHISFHPHIPTKISRQQAHTLSHIKPLFAYYLRNIHHRRYNRQPQHRLQHPNPHQHHQYNHPQKIVPPPKLRPVPTTKRRIHKLKRQLGAQMLDGDFQPTAEPVLVEPILRPRPAIAHTPRVLDTLESLLRPHARRGVEGMPVDEFALREARVWSALWV